MSGPERLGPLRLLARATGAFAGSVLGERAVQAIYYLTYQCQSRCVYCDMWRRGGAMAETAEVVRNIEALKDLAFLIRSHGPVRVQANSVCRRRTCYGLEGRGRIYNDGEIGGSSIFSSRKELSSRWCRQ